MKKTNQHAPGSFRLSLTQECLTIGAELGLAGAGLVIITLLRDRWANRTKDGITLGNKAVTKYGISDKKRRAILRQLEAKGWIKIDNGENGKRCNISILKEF
jgi:hypothetical protein